MARLLIRDATRGELRGDGRLQPTVEKRIGMNRKQGKVQVKSGRRTFYVEPGPHGAIFEEDSGGMLVPAKGLNPTEAEQLRQIAETRMPPRPR